MKRLVYSPKVYAWVRVEDERRDAPDRIFNLSSYIVSGRVDRKLDSVSSAELVIRNPNKKFTRPHDLYFRPMDPITIWMSRLNDYPVQVFTGYLDRTPYLQLHPGIVNLTASCTLKRLLHTYWDPALPYVNTFLAQYGWKADRASGTIANFEEMRRNIDEGVAADTNEDGTVSDEERRRAEKDAAENPDEWPLKNAPPLNDGTIGKLLYATLKHVGEWKEEDIMIEPLPKNIVNDVRRIFDAFESDSIQMKESIELFLENVIGKGSFGNFSAGAGEIEGVQGTAEALYQEAVAISEATPGYSYGGGHGPPLSEVRRTQALDCSGAISLALYRTGLFEGRKVAIASGEFASSYGKSGKGEQFTIWANSGHVFMEFHGLGQYKRLDTGGPGGGNGPKVHTSMRSTAGFTPRHLNGF